MRVPIRCSMCRACAVGLAAAALGLAACVGPRFHRPAAPAVQHYVPPAERTESLPASPDQRLLPGSEAPREWWHEFRSADLDRLVEAAQRANPNLQAAQAALHQAVEYARAQRATFWPSVGVQGNASRDRDALQVVQGTLQSGAPVYTLFNTQAIVSFVPDVFGMNRHLVESAEAAAENAAWQREATSLTLTGNVVTAALQIAGLRAQIEATQKLLELQRDSLSIQRRGESLGAGSGVAVLAQESALAATAASLPPLRLQLEQTRHWLSVLTGRYPQESWAEDALTLDQLVLPADVPLGVPAKLVEHRPDVRAAEAALHGATAQAGVATAALLPQIEITGDIGSTATSLGTLFQSGTGFWSGAVSLSQVLFDAGAARHRRRAALAAVDQAGAQYRLAVLGAYQNVADSLQALSAAAETQLQCEIAARTARQTLDIVQRQAELGAESYLALIEAQKAWFQAQSALAVARTQRLTSTAALFQALAGNAPAASAPAH
ncbi:MAG: efflux transporter outer membrane subunit [Proteobacteria bacterium]|nr:efflux transporter outer membrane subunit [Pseudomonadota bacterium]